MLVVSCWNAFSPVAMARERKGTATTKNKKNLPIQGSRSIEFHGISINVDGPGMIWASHEATEEDVNSEVLKPPVTDQYHSTHP